MHLRIATKAERVLVGTWDCISLGKREPFFIFQPLFFKWPWLMVPSLAGSDVGFTVGFRLVEGGLEVVGVGWACGLCRADPRPNPP